MATLVAGELARRRVEMLTQPRQGQLASACLGALTRPQLDAPQPPTPNRTARLAARQRVLDAKLRQMFPCAFCSPPVPLAIGIRSALSAALGDDWRDGEVSRFLRRWTQNADYLAALARGGARRNADGSPAGEVTAEHAAAARDTLSSRYPAGATEQALGT
jgi:sRNA-binding protein